MAGKLKFLKKIPKRVLLAVLLVFGIVGWLFFSRTRQEPIEFATVTRQDIQTVVSASGILAGKETVNLKFKSSGKLAYLKAKAGDKVKKGQAVAGLDTQDLSITLQQALNTLRDKQATAEKVLDEVKNHDKDETFAQKATRTTAEVARDNAYDSVRAAQRAFQDAVVISPITGIITQQTELSPGQFISPSDLVAQVTDFSEKLFLADVDETDIAKIKVGQKAEITLNTYADKVFTGTVSEILPQTKTASSGATTVTVKIKTDEKEIPAISGLNGQANIVISEAKDVLTLPQEAVVDEKYVLVESSRGPMKKEISLGIKSDADVEVKSGLQEGDRVVINPQQALMKNGSVKGIFGLFRPRR